MSNPHPQVTAIKAFNDNYIWAISAQTRDNVAFVDPGDANVCIKHLESKNLVLSAILITHHHKDHVGGINKLLEYAKNNAWPVTVYGPASEAIEQIDVTLVENDVVNIDSVNGQFKVLDLPGHTNGHIAYYNDAMLFCGDTLFSGGCGRLFEGSPEQMHQSLTKLANLPAQTLVYCAHEYTQANLTFALAVEPENDELNKYSELVKLKRQNDQATIPSNIALERKINPFLRCHEQSVKRAAQAYTNQNQATDTDVFTAIRAWKDNF